MNTLKIAGIVLLAIPGAVLLLAIKFGAVALWLNFLVGLVVG